MVQKAARLGAVAVTALLIGAPAVAEPQGPLSAIDWLGTQLPPTPAALPPRPAKPAPAPNEPPVSKNALAPQVNVQPLATSGPRAIGLVPAQITGLPADLWTGSDVNKLTDLIATLPDLNLPAAQSLLYTLLLAEARAPGDVAAAGDQLVLARVEKLVQRGALDPALSLIEQAGVRSSPAHFDLWMDISLLTGTEDRACGVLSEMPHITQDYAVRIFCAARAGEWEDAALTLGSAKALGLVPDEQLDLLARFIDPDAAEGLPPLSVPRKMDPLSFRLFEAIGEPIPTTNLPRPYAVADLRDLAGWKAQIEAAERLTRAGALPDNRLLGLYSERKAAASGGVWDRVAAWQRFETALEAQSTEAVSKTILPVWREMTSAGIEVSFATLFADSLSEFKLTGRAADTAATVALLSPSYERVGSGRSDLAGFIARGAVPLSEGETLERPEDLYEGAVFDAFTTAQPRADLVAMVAQGRLGESILQVLTLMHKGTAGNARALTDALGTLRALGLEDTARRAALQVLLLERG
ncbi:hypothetical protein Z946_4117 [Sulfitobacter noctilucicola]|uniref:Antifreeze protein n=1 Tax=Sulfitobacter noctilucicola TaxID=1342301 RepID=A0A7W6Q401_9RHOB|nr:hypothetical protein [Sulfitobacter noctilucicola]KIN65217.1 hypothetical protein Z946_4117 [Sulfitobacter noctilucicola]MBB4173649.1 hypothetical protein [Sulfitobacter noctilucicola]